MEGTGKRSWDVRRWHRFPSHGFFFDAGNKERDFRLHEETEAKPKEIRQGSNGWSVKYRQTKLNQVGGQLQACKMQGKTGGY